MCFCYNFILEILSYLKKQNKIRQASYEISQDDNKTTLPQESKPSSDAKKQPEKTANSNLPNLQESKLPSNVKQPEETTKKENKPNKENPTNALPESETTFSETQLFLKEFGITQDVSKF